MDKDFTCNKCNTEYTATNQPRLLTMCGHTFCSNCIKALIAKKKDGKFKITCPEDNETMELKENKVSCFPKNVALMKFNNNKKIILTPDKNSQYSKKSPSPNSNADSNSFLDEYPQKTHIDQIITQQQPIMMMGIKKKLPILNDQNLCLLHQKPLEIYCVEDISRICASCAIFGDHKGHNFKQINQIEATAQKRYQDILTIMDKKNTFVKKISADRLHKQSFQSLTQRKTKIKKQIGDKYKKIVQLIKNWQKQTYAKADLIFCQTEQKLKNLLRLDDKIAKKYMQWESVAIIEIKMLQAENIEEKMAILYGCDTLAQNTVVIGNQLLNEIKQQQMNLSKKIEETLGNICLSFNQQALNTAKNFVKIQDKSEQVSSYYLLDVPRAQKGISYMNRTFDSPTIKSPHRSFEVPLLEQSLLDDQQEPIQFNHYQIGHGILPDMDITQQKPLKQVKSIQALKLPKSPKALLSRSTKIFSEKTMKFTSQKKKVNKIPEQYQRLYNAILKDNTDVVDLTSGELEDNIILNIIQKIGSNVKAIKLAKNRLTDQGLQAILPYCGNITTLNLAQNCLTEKSLLILIQKTYEMPNLKSIVLSQNKFLQRKNKDKIEKLKDCGIVVTI